MEKAQRLKYLFLGVKIGPEKTSFSQYLTQFIENMILEHILCFILGDCSF